MNELWPLISDHLNKKYNIIAEIDLVELDSDPQLLYGALKLAYRERYEPDDRILIYHYDTDFYLSGGPGFTISNLMTCLNSLDISVNFCLLLTNHYGISNEIAQLSQCDLSMPVFENNYTSVQTTPNPNQIDINIEKIHKPFICMNGQKRSHRVLFLCYLKENMLLDKGIMSWHFNSNKKQLVPPVEIKTEDIKGHNPELVFVTTDPFVRINDKFTHDDQSRRIFRDHQACFSGSFKDPCILGESNSNRWNIPAVQDALLYVSVETVLQYPYPYLTEKTFRSILHKRPFVIVGAPGSLVQIKKLGFKTFSTVWCEDYDSIDDPNERMRAVVEIVKKIGSLTSDQLKNLMYSVQDVVEFNYKFYVEEFSDSILKNRLNTL